MLTTLEFKLFYAKKQTNNKTKQNKKSNQELSNNINGGIMHSPNYLL